MFRLKSPVIFNQERLPYLIIPQSPTSRIEPGLDISTVSTDCEITAKSAAKYPVEADSINDLQASHINKLVAAPDTVDSETSNSSQNATNTTLAGNADLHISLEKVFRCDECSKSFGKLYLLKSHQAVHKGIKINVCQFCKKSFTRRHDMLRHERTVHQKEIVSDKHKHIAENGNNVIRTIDFPPSIATHDALPGNQQEAAGLNSIKRPAESFRMHDAKRISYSSRFSLPRPASKMDNQNPGELDALLLLNLQPYHRLPDVPHNANSLVSDHQIPQSNTERSHILPPSPSHSSPSTDVFPTSSFNFIPPTGIIEHLSYVKENAPPFFSIFETDVINGEADDEIGDYQDGLGDNYDFLYDDNK